MGIRLPRNGWRSLWRDQSGATALITGLALLLIACAGMTIFDLGHVQSEKAKLQDMLDAAALAAAKVGGEDEDAIKAAGDAHLKAHLPPGVYKNLVVTFTPNDKTVRATATAAIEPYFLNMFMNGPVDLALDAEVTRALDGSLEIALVLDTTDSMSFDNKLPDLKVAAKALVEKVTENEDADVRIAVVPFANYVNVGKKSRNESWVSVGSDYTVPATPSTCKDEMTYRNECTGKEEYSCPYKVDGVTVQRTCTRGTNCTRVENGVKNVCRGGSSAQHYQFRGCIGSPAYPKNVSDNNPTPVYPGILEKVSDPVCANEITPLEDKPQHVRNAINQLKPAQSTYLPSGLLWGLNVLSPAIPYTEAKAYDPDNKKPRKAVVVMSDGANTMKVQAGGSGYHVADGSGAQANQYSLELCKAIKARKIDVYTVAFKIDDPNAHKMLSDCASSPGNYFKADNAVELLEAFKKIAESLENLRISH
jgi:Flp pilus assembly protein TadG